MTDTSSAIAGYRGAAAPSFDDEPDHGLRAERTCRAWAHRLRERAPPAPAEVLDVGCGTGSLFLPPDTRRRSRPATPRHHPPATGPST